MGVLQQADLDLGVAPLPVAQDDGQDAERRRCCHRHLQAAEFEPKRLAHRPAPALGVLQSGVGLGEELLPGGGEAHSARQTLEQLSAELLLKGTDLLGEGRLGDQEVLGGGGDRAVLGDRHEVLELA